MARRWKWAPGLAPAWHEALARTFDPDALAPVATAPSRQVAGRGYGLLVARPDLPFDVFVKAFADRSWGGRLRHLLGRSGAAREFARAVRLHAMGIAVARPLALASEAVRGTGRRCYFLMEYLARGVPLSQALEDASGEGPEQLRALVDATARLLAELAAAGAWFRDARAANFYVLVDPGDRALEIRLIDARHTWFGSDPAEALARMLVTFGAFLYRDGAEPTVVEALVRAASAEATTRGGVLAGFRTDGLLDRAGRAGADLLARDIRKGRRSAEDLDRFADRYATAGDAANYRDRRFGRSRHGRTVDAAERRIVDDLVRRLGVRGPVLDVPCGTGRFIPVFAGAGCEVLAGDVSSEMLALARRTAGEVGAACRCTALDARQLPMLDGCVELAFAMRLLHRVRDPAERVAVLRELGRVSRRWVLFSFYNRRSARGLRDQLRGRYPGETRSAIRRDVAEAGLRLEEFLPVGRLARQTLVLCSVAPDGGGA